MATTEQIYDPFLSTATGTQINNAAAKVAGMEETLSGTAGVIPSSKAVKDAIDARISESSGRTYYTVFDEDNCQVIEGYSYTHGDDALTAAPGERCYLADVDFDGITLTGTNISYAIISGLNGTSLVDKTYSNKKTSTYSWITPDMNAAFKNGKGTKKLLFHSPSTDNGSGLYAMESAAPGKVCSIFGISNEITDTEYLIKAADVNGKSAAIITAYNNHGELPANLTNQLVVAEEQSHMVGSAYTGKLSLCPMGDYPSNIYHVRYCPNITHLNVDVSDNTNIEKVCIDYDLQLERLYLKLNSDQSIRLSANPNLKTVELAGQFNLEEPSTFYKCPSLERVDMTNAVSIGVLYLFQGCSSLEWVDLTNIPLNMSWNRVNVNCFTNCVSLQTLIGDHTLAEVQAGTVVLFPELRYNLKIDQSPLLNRASLLAIIKGAHDFSQDSGFDENNTYATLTVGDTLLDVLTNDDITELMLKGWGIV